MKPLAAFSTFSLYCAALWLAALLPTELGAWVVKVLAFMPGLTLILWRAGTFDVEKQRPDAAVERLFARLGWSGTFWLAIAMTIHSVIVSELVASEALAARIAVGVLVSTTGLGLAAIAWMRAGSRARHVGQS